MKTLKIICHTAGFEPRTFNWPAESDLQSSIWPLWWHQWHLRLTFLIGSAKNARKRKWPGVTFSEKLKKISNFKTSFFQQLRSTVWNARTRNVWRYGKTVTDFFWCRDFCSNKIIYLSNCSTWSCYNKCTSATSTSLVHIKGRKVSFGR